MHDLLNPQSGMHMHTASFNKLAGKDHNEDALCNSMNLLQK